MNSFFKELFEYSHYTNQKLAAVFLEQADKTSEKSVKLFSHILDAHHIWNSRILNEKSRYGVWDLQSVEEFNDIDLLNYQNTLRVLETSNLMENIQYKTSSGHPFTNSIRDILFHAVNHSTYHRGQIALEFKAGGLDPLMTDYIFYKR